MKNALLRTLAGLAVGVAVAGGVALPVSPALAQVRIAMSTSSGRGSMSAIGRSSFKDYGKLLGLSEDQVQSATELFDGYRAAFKTAKDENDAKMQSISENMQESGDFQASIKEMQEQSGRFSEASAKLEETFMADLKALLTDKQADRWPAVERHRRRENGLRMGFYSGAGVDLLSMVAKMGADPGTPEFSALMEQYEVEMDRRLQENERKMGDAAKEGGKADAFDFAAQQEQMKKMGESSKTIRDLNRDYVKRMGGLMDGEHRGAFEAEFNRRSFPDVYKETYTEQCLKAAATMPDLDTAQKEAVANLLSQYQKDAGPLNESWSKAINKAEEDAGGSMLMEMNKWSGGGQKEDVKKARADRKELDSRVAKRLDELLTPTQREKLPPKKPSEDGPGGFRIRIGGPGGAADGEGEED
ncbi:MAG: hypothetical protein U0637_09080 [Phycisphaerales bacterium]